MGKHLQEQGAQPRIGTGFSVKEVRRKGTDKSKEQSGIQIDLGIKYVCSDGQAREQISRTMLPPW
jgi:hypothetical protein